jgi:hypothetical protein
MPPEFGIRKQGIDHSHLQHKPMLLLVALLLVKFILSKSIKDVLKFIFFYKFFRYISVIVNKKLRNNLYYRLHWYFSRLHWYGGVTVLLPGQVIWK